MFERHDYNLKKMAKEIVQELSVHDLTYAIHCAKRDYFFGTDKNESGERTRMKNYLSLGASTLFRGLKANSRLPNTDEIHAHNVKQVLEQILLSDGGNGNLSLKYLVASHLFYKYESVSNTEASAMVNALLTEVKAQLAAPQELVAQKTSRSPA